MISVYLKDSVGMNAENKLVCEHVAAAVRCLDGPCVMAGDWNMEPDTLAKSGFLGMVNGTVFAPSLPTCNGKKYNYFVVTNNFSHAVAGVQRIEGVGTQPHFPSRLLLRGDARRFMVRNLVRSKRVPPVLMHGPQPKPPSYENVLRLAGGVPLRTSSSDIDNKTKEDITTAISTWRATARSEFDTISSDNLQYRQAHFVMRSAAAKTASPWGPSSCISAVWRGLATRTFETAALLARATLDETQKKVIHMHAKALHGAIELVPKTARDEFEIPFQNVANGFAEAVERNSRSWLLSLCKLAKRKAELLENSILAMRRAHWKEVIGVTAENGSSKKPRPTKAAYRYVRGNEGWVSSPVAQSSWNNAVQAEDDAQGDTNEIEQSTFDDIAEFTPDEANLLVAPLCDQASVDQQASTWGELWLTECEYKQPMFELQRDMFIDLAPDLIPLAAATFPGDTGLGEDNVAPRALQRLSPEALAALAALFMAFERLGDWPTLLNLIVLLPKAEGGFRPIGLFPTEIRIWFRVRLLTIKNWEKQNEMDSVYGGPGMGAQKAAFQIAVVAETAALERIEFGAGLLDLVKAFETVPHHILVQIALEMGYPLVLLRLCLASYRIKRSIGIEGVYSKTVVATRGIIAGSGTATTELKLLLLPLMKMQKQQWANSLIAKVYVDDLTLIIREFAHCCFSIFMSGRRRSFNSVVAVPEPAVMPRVATTVLE